MSELRRYPDYKDSGVPWLGEIPSHWEAKAIKRISRVHRGASPRPIADVKYFDDEGEYAWVRIADVTASEDYLLETTQRLSELGASLSVKMQPDQIFLSIAGSVGKPIITKIKACIHDGFVYFPDWNQSNRFLYYIFASGQPYLGLGKLGTQLNLNTETVGSIKVGMPNLDEQQAIVNFLDTELAHIDTLIDKQQQLIEKLAEQRSAVITHAVTKGLDSNVTMKDSGVEWLGNIPEHWEATKLKYYFDIQLGKMLQPNSTSSDDFEVKYLKAMHVQWDNVKVLDLPQMWCNERELDKYEVYNGDLLICEGGEVGRSALIRDLEGTTIIQNALHRLRSTNAGDVRYLDYLIRHIADSEWFSILCNKATIAHLTGDKLANTFITLPPLTEQIKIINYLDSQTQKMDEMSDSNKSIIAKLQEYRAALITQAVTGKIDVRDIATGNGIEEIA